MTPSPLYIGSPKSEEFQKKCKGHPNHIFNPQAYGIGSNDTPTNPVVCFMQPSGLNELNSNFIAGYIESGGEVFCLAFLGAYAGRIRRLKSQMAMAAERSFGTLGELGMFLQHGLKLKFYIEKHPDDDDVKKICAWMTNNQAKQRKINELKKSMIFGTRFMFECPNPPQVAARNFLVNRDLLRLLEREYLDMFSELQNTEAFETHLWH